MNAMRAATAILALTILSACAQPEPEPMPVAPEPTYDKYGNVVS
ncbi:hypothetical protein [Rhodalgimonas zhirmunskyi]|nr:hypothetical protein [Rhodoalgimonas zhirmunskyi]